MSQVEIYSGSKEVIASGTVVLADTESPLKIVLFKGEIHEFSLVFKFQLVDDANYAKTVDLRPLGKNGAEFTVYVVRKNRGFFTSSKPFAESPESFIYAAFKVSASTSDKVEFVYTFLKEDKLLSDGVTPVANSTKRVGKKG